MRTDSKKPRSSWGRGRGPQRARHRARPCVVRDLGRSWPKGQARVDELLHDHLLDDWNDDEAVDFVPDRHVERDVTEWDAQDDILFCLQTDSGRDVPYLVDSPTGLDYSFRD